MSTGMPPYAEPRETSNAGWYVFWNSGLAYGSIGMNMTQEHAIELAGKVRTGEVKP